MSVLDDLLRQPRTVAIPDVTRSFDLVIGAGRRVGNVAFSILCFLLAAGAVVLHLVLQTQLSAGAFAEQSLMTDVRTSQAAVQGLQQQSSVMSASATLSLRANKLGMVPMASPVFIRLTDGKILGDAQPATLKTKLSNNAPTMDTVAVALNADGSNALQLSQLPTDDAAVLVSKSGTKK